MSEQNLTVWQRLSQTFGPNSLLKQDYPTFKFDKKELLRTPNRDDYEREKLQAQQTFYLTNQWAKVENNLYSQAIYYEPSRLSAQYDYESMEYTPEISAALDIYSEESTTTNEDGFILQIYSESKRIKSVLADLFNNALDINTNLPMWTRNTCKYGDNFVYMKLDPEKGIVGCQQLPTIEIERHEVGVTAKITVDITQEKDENKKALHFTWKNRNMEFQSWEIAHFRLLGDDRKLPYGTSMLEKARRIWKQLLLSEDAMLIYRTSRAPERRMFKVFVGNMNDDDVEAYVNRVANKFKREQIVDAKTGNVDMRFNQMAVDQDYFIPVRDPAAPDPITTLPGATNLSEIADIEYIQKKLLTALRVPKAFLGFEEVVGDGSCALHDKQPVVGGIEFQLISGTAGDYEVIPIAESQGSVHGVELSTAFVHKNNLVCVCIFVKVIRHAFAGCGKYNLTIIVYQHRFSGLQVVVCWFHMEAFQAAVF